MEQEEKKSTPKVATKVVKKNPLGDYFSSVDFSKLEVSIRDMFKSGVHFGHHKSRKNPKMNEYIFATKNNIDIIDLEKTQIMLKEAMKFIAETVAKNEDILFIGTKKQAKKIIQEVAEKCGMPYVNERWLGGTFTNFSMISTRTRYLREGTKKMEQGEYAKYTKFEQVKKAEELERLERRMGGIKEMRKFPGAIFATSVNEDNLAIQEAHQKNIPIIAFVDTNVNPKNIDYPIPANEDAISSLKLMLSYISKAVLDGKEQRKSVIAKK